MSGATTTRLGLPMLVPGQAQKDMTHNEALAMLDLLLCGVVEGVASAPPPTPADGACWIVGTGASGAFSGRTHALAGWTAGGWRFVDAREGLSVRVAESGRPMLFRGGAWRTHEPLGERGDAIPVPTGGGVIDEQARAAISAMLLILRDFGLIDAA